MLSDLRDIGRLDVLHRQACARGWLQRSEAERLNVVAAAVHAQRIGHDPCRLFVALLRDRRWEVITQEDEDRARLLLREHADGPRRRAAPEGGSVMPMPDDARFVLLAQEVLHQAGWYGDPFLAVKMQYPEWPRARWDEAMAALEEWQRHQRQANARMQGGLQGIMECLEEGLDREKEDDG
jgi:hypothetical protein